MNGRSEFSVLGALLLIHCGGRSPLDPCTDCDAAPAGCDITKPFGAPRPVLGAESACSASFSPDERVIFFGLHGGGIRTASRPTRFTPFGSVAAIADSNSAPSISNDGRTLFFEALEKPCGPNEYCYRIHESQRSTIDGPFGADVVVPVINDGAASTGGSLYAPFITQDGETLYFDWANGAPRNHIWRSHREGSSWSKPELLQELVTLGGEASAVVAADNRTIYFLGGWDTSADYGVRVATRMSTNDPFRKVEVVPGLTHYSPHWLSVDGCRLYVDRFSVGECVFEVVERPAR